MSLDAATALCQDLYNHPYVADVLILTKTTIRSACNEIISGVSRIAELGVYHSYTSGAMWPKNFGDIIVDDVALTLTRRSRSVLLPTLPSKLTTSNTCCWQRSMVVGWSIKSETAIFGLRKEWKLSRPFGRAESVPGLAWNILSKLNCGGQ